MKSWNYDCVGKVNFWKFTVVEIMRMANCQVLQFLIIVHLLLACSCIWKNLETVTNLSFLIHILHVLSCVVYRQRIIVKDKLGRKYN
jgi:hypothetical protein